MQGDPGVQGVKGGPGAKAAGRPGTSPRRFRLQTLVCGRRWWRAGEGSRAGRAQWGAGGGAPGRRSGTLEPALPSVLCWSVPPGRVPAWPAASQVTVHAVPTGPLK